MVAIRRYLFDIKGWLLAFWGATIALAAFPPGPAPFLVFIGPAPLWWLCRNCDARTGFARGLFFGLGFYTHLLWWLTPTLITFGPIHWAPSAFLIFLLSLYMALFPALSGWLTSVAGRGGQGAALALAPFIWTGAEGLKGWLFSGFPWGSMAQPLWQEELALALAPWVGMIGAGLVLGSVGSVVATLLARLISRNSKVGYWWILGSAPAALALALLLVPSPVPIEDGGIGVLVVQGNIDQAVKWDPAYKNETFDIYGRMSRGGRERAIEKMDLIVWPETAMPLFPQVESIDRLWIERLATEQGMPILFGSPGFVKERGETEYFNSVFVMGKRGEIIDRYDKNHLVPFGEYIPFGKYFPFVKKLVSGAGNFRPGDKLAPLSLGKDRPKVGPLVCFESAFADLAAEQVKAGAGFLAVLTNDAWFGDTPGPHHHLAFSAWRSAENGRWLVRAANTGISALFDSRGRMRVATKLNTRSSFSAKVGVIVGELTPHTYIGPWIAPASWVLAFLSLFAILRRPSQRRDRHQSRG